jgi:hypothetical protein
LGYHEGDRYYPSHGYPEPSLRARTSASARYPNWYAPLERYVSYGVDQAKRVLEGDEDINTSATIIPSIEILGPITRSRAQ